MNTTEHMSAMYMTIELAVKAAHKDGWGAVMPYEVQRRLPFDRAEGSLRRDMLAMYRCGRLVRVGGEGARQGYRLPTQVERLSFRINRGIWPLGAERVVTWAM
jgi:hypothetical protein